MGAGPRRAPVSARTQSCMHVASVWPTVLVVSSSLQEDVCTGLSMWPLSVVVMHMSEHTKEIGAVDELPILHGSHRARIAQSFARFSDARCFRTHCLNQETNRRQKQQAGQRAQTRLCTEITESETLSVSLKSSLWSTKVDLGRPQCIAVSSL